MGIHFGTFRLADDSELEPVSDLDAALAEQSLSREEFWVLGFGEGRDVPPLESERVQPQMNADEHR